MPYITSVEEIGYDRGLEAGEKKRARSTALRLISRRFGTVEASVAGQVETISIEQLDELTDVVLDAKSIVDITDWLASNMV